MLFASTAFMSSRTSRMRRAESERIAAMVGHPYPSLLTEDAEPENVDYPQEEMLGSDTLLAPFPSDKRLAEGPELATDAHRASAARIARRSELIFARIRRQCAYSVFLGSVLASLAHLMVGLPGMALSAYVLGSTASVLSVMVVLPRSFHTAS